MKNSERKTDCYSCTGCCKSSLDKALTSLGVISRYKEKRSLFMFVKSSALLSLVPCSHTFFTSDCCTMLPEGGCNSRPWFNHIHQSAVCLLPSYLSHVFLFQPAHISAWPCFIFLLGLINFPHKSWLQSHCVQTLKRHLMFARSSSYFLWKTALSITFSNALKALHTGY